MIENPKIASSLAIRPGQAVAELAEKLSEFFTQAVEYREIKEKQLIRVSVAVEPIDPFLWLLQQKQDVKVYWRDRENVFAMAGIGVADQVTETPAVNDITSLFERLALYLRNPYPNLRYYGGMRFNLHNISEDKWRQFGAFHFIVPRFEIYRENAAAYLSCNFVYDPREDHQLQWETLLMALNEVKWNTGLPDVTIPKLITRTDFPDREGWRKNIQTVLALFDRGDIEKIVLARKSRFQFAGKLNAVDLLRRLQKIDQRAFHFCFQPYRNVAFIGGTPERLYCRCHREIQSEAVAGTRPRSSAKAVDREFNNELLRSDKDMREHRFVFDSIIESFNNVCSIVDAQEKVSVLKLSKVQHLYAGIRGILNADVTDGQILSHLHPTPAVGGFPREKALRLIDSLEPFDRGWYAGPVGWVSKDAAEFAVAIRSGLIKDDKIYLYAGAGIVPGSSPDKEWEEIENKIGNFIK
jgi:menaquinone-specific isochorismate synthase